MGPPLLRWPRLAGALIAAGLLARLSAGAVLEDAPTPLGLEEAFSMAVAANKTIAAARLRQGVDLAGVELARERPNPELRLEATRETPRQSLSVGLPLELGGKRSRRIELAEAVVRTGETELARALAEVRGAVRRAFYAVASGQRRTAIAQEIEHAVERARDAARARFDAGDASRLETLQAEVALLQARNEAEAAAGEVAASRCELNALIGRDPRAATAVSEEIEVAPLAEPQALLADALARSVALALVDRQMAEAEARAALARAEQVPDPTLEGAVTHDSPPEFEYGWRASIGLAVPVFTRHRAAARIEEADLLRLRTEREALAERLRGGVVASAARAEAQRQQFLRYRDQILPSEREVESMAEDSYRSGQTGLVSLLLSLQSAREIRLKALQSAADYQAALADLEQVTLLGPK